MSFKKEKRTGDTIKEELEKLFADPHRDDEAIIQLVRKHFEL